MSLLSTAELEKDFRATVEITIAKALATPKLMEQLVSELLVDDDERKRRLGGSTGLVRKVLRQAVTAAVEEQVVLWVKDNAAITKQLVQSALETTLTPALVSDQVMSYLSGMELTIKPFGNAKKKSTTAEQYDEEDD